MGSRPVGILSKQGECVCWWREKGEIRLSPEPDRQDRDTENKDGETGDRHRTERTLDEMFGARRTGTGAVARLWVLVSGQVGRVPRRRDGRADGQMDGVAAVSRPRRTEDSARGATLSPPRPSRPTPSTSWSPVSVAKDTNWPQFPMDAIRVSGRHQNWAPGSRMKRSTVMWANGRDAGEGRVPLKSRKSPGAPCHWSPKTGAKLPR